MKLLLRHQKERHILPFSSDCPTLLDLHRGTLNYFSLPADALAFKVGFPPVSLPPLTNTSQFLPLNTLNVHNNDLIIVENIPHINETVEIPLSPTQTHSLVSPSLPSSAPVCLSLNANASNCLSSVTGDTSAGNIPSVTAPSTTSPPMSAKRHRKDLLRPDLSEELHTLMTSLPELENEWKRMASLNISIREMTRVPIAADNSCLFRSVCYLLKLSVSPKCLRDLVAKIVLEEREKYMDAIFERPREAYAEWIRLDTSWGGFIELNLLADYFKIQFAVYNIETTRLDVYGVTAPLLGRVYLLYDGLHYDPIVGKTVSLSSASHDAPNKPPSFHSENYEVLLFPVNDVLSEQKAFLVAEKLHQAHMYTNGTLMKFKCLICGIALTGEKEAIIHAKLTGHANIGETR